MTTRTILTTPMLTRRGDGGLRRMTTRPILATSMLLAALCLSHQAALAGPAAVERPIPGRFFNENTIAVAHLNLENISAANVLATLKAIVPAKYAEPLSDPKAAQQLGAVDVFVGQLRATGASHVSAVLIANDPLDFKNVSAYVLLPLKAQMTDEQKAEQVAALGGLAQSFGGRAELLGSWAVVTNAAALPADDGPVSVRDAPFYDALVNNPDHDLAFAFVPTQMMRQAMDAAKAQSRESADEDAQRMLNDLEPLTRGEWYYLSVKLGASPQLRLVTHLAAAEQARGASGRFNSMLSWGKEKYKEQMAKEKQKAIEKAQKRNEPIDYKALDERYDPQPGMDMLDALRSQADETRVVVHLDRARMQKLVKGLISVAESIGAAIGEAIGEGITGG